MSPKNSIPAIVSLFDRTSCQRVIAEPSFTPILSVVEEELSSKGIQLKVDHLPELYDVFPQLREGDSEPSRTEKPFPPFQKPRAMTDVVFYLHSSGSTGLPKPIALRGVQTLQWCLSCT